MPGNGHVVTNQGIMITWFGGMVVKWWWWWRSRLTEGRKADLFGIINKEILHDPIHSLH